MEIKTRAEAEKKYTWATEDLFSTDEDFLASLEDAKRYTEGFSSYRGTLADSAARLLEYCRFAEEVGLAVERLGNYCMRKHDEDTSNPVYQALRGKFISLYTEISEASSWQDPELTSISEDTFKAFYAAEPELLTYKRSFDRLLAKKPHILPVPEEKLLAGAAELAEASGQIAEVFRNADLSFPDAADSEGAAHTLTQGTYISLMESPDRELRRSAFTNLYGTFGSYKNTLASCLDNNMRALRYFARSRGYKNAMEKSLSQNEVPVSVYTSLIDAVHQGLPLVYRYMALRRKISGLSELHMYDIYAPLVPEADIKISYEEAARTVCEALSVLGEDYVSVLREGFENRWIDVYENKGKRSGAYSSAGRPHPYVLLNHKDTLNGMYTLAHEMGHALHTYFSIKNQPVADSDYVIFVAEVASTCNEALLTSYLLERTDDKIKRAYIVNHFLEQFRTTLFRQTMFAEFEMKISELSESGETLSAETLSKLYAELNALYYGPDVVQDPEIALEWSRIPHFFYDFYVFQYATGFAAATALSRRILQGGQEAVSAYRSFLSAGSSADPITILKNAGVDMTKPEPVAEALKLFSSLIDELEALLS